MLQKKTMCEHRTWKLHLFFYGKSALSKIVCVQVLVFDSDGSIQSLKQDLHTLQPMEQILNPFLLENKQTKTKPQHCTIPYSVNILTSFKKYPSIKMYDQDNFLIALEL